MNESFFLKEYSDSGKMKLDKFGATNYWNDNTHKVITKSMLQKKDIYTSNFSLTDKLKFYLVHNIKA